MMKTATGRTLIAACVLIAAVPVRAARDPADELIREIIAGAKTDKERAAKLFEAAKVLTKAQKTQTILLKKAVEYGMKALTSPTCCQMVAEAIDLLEERFPKRKDEWTLKRADVCRALYRTTRGRSEKRKAGEAMVAALLAAGELHEKTKNWTAAAAAYKEAHLAAVYLRLGGTDHMLQKRRAAAYFAAASQKAARHAATVKKDPSKIAIRALLLETLVIELNDPAEARKHLTEDVDETWRTYVPLACLPLRRLKATVCKELGDWYSKSF